MSRIGKMERRNDAGTDEPHRPQWIKMRRPEQPDDRGDDQRDHRHLRQQMKPMMAGAQ